MAVRPGRGQVRQADGFFSWFEGLAGNRFIERVVIDEVMYELMRLGGQEYVDLYAADVKDNGGNVGQAAGPHAGNSRRLSRQSTPAG